MGVNWPLILRNATKYPLWLARIYSYTLDTTNHALLVVCYASIRLWRTGQIYRKYLLLAVAWIAVFLIVPVYSGGYFWHGNLALCGYCMLFGMALDWGVGRIDARVVRFAVLALVIAGMVALTRMDAAACLIFGIHSESYRINSTVLRQQPVPFERMQEKPLVRPLVYVEDRNSLGLWNFGAGSLFNVVYLRQNLSQVLVPAMNKVGQAKCEEWIKHPNAFLFPVRRQSPLARCDRGVSRICGEEVERAGDSPEDHQRSSIRDARRGGFQCAARRIFGHRRHGLLFRGGRGNSDQWSETAHCDWPDIYIGYRSAGGLCAARKHFGSS